jgi:steroid delta-isomerase-like uncharacterized protein
VLVPTEENKAVVHRFYEEFWNRGELAVLEDCVAPEVVADTPRGRTTVPRDGLGDAVTRWRQAFPDFRFAVDQVVAEGDSVAVNARMTGTHRGVFHWATYGPWEPTGKTIDVREMIFFRLAEGRVVEMSLAWDQLTLARQLGVSLSPGSSTG